MNVEAIVRPLVTVVLVAAQIALAFVWAFFDGRAEQAFAALSPFTSMAVIFWFKSRDEEHAAEATATAVAAVATPGAPAAP